MLATVALAQVAGRTYERPAPFASITDRRVNESSGLAPSREFPGEYFTHNDSGDSARFFRFNNKGEVTAEFSLKGVRAVDIEDMESARVRGVNYVYLADVGDNNARRDDVRVYRFEEPKGAGGEITKFDTFTLRYPGGPRNSETLMVDPKTGDLWTVEKRNGQGGIYRVRHPRRSGSFTWEFMGRIEFPDGPTPMRLVTGGSASPEGTHLVLRTYAYAYEFPIPGNDFRSWLTSRSSRIDVANEVQGEAITYSLDGRSLLTTTEGSPCRVSEMRRR